MLRPKKVTNKMKVLIYGAGAIGLTLTGWLSQQYDNIYVLAREKAAGLLRKGLYLYKKGKKDLMEKIDIKVITDTSEISEADLIIITVKNYDLEEVCKDIKSKMVKEPIVLGIQNGVINQEILPRYFSKCIYGIGTYNAWRDEKNIVGYQNKGKILIGTPNNELSQEMEKIVEIMSLGSPFEIIDNLYDATLCKIVINLTTTISTLTAQGYEEIADIKTFKKITTHVLQEGIQILKALGVKEVQLGNVPKWKIIELVMKLPDFIGMVVFKKNYKKLVISSMAYDIIKAGKKKSEIDTISGHLVSLAERNGIKARYNKAVYKIGKEKFSQVPFKSMKPKELWDEINRLMLI
jgi:2-dehydropantoate 2-reductase